MRKENATERQIKALEDDRDLKLRQNADTQTTRISNVKNSANVAPKPLENAGILAILGDIGTATMDCVDMDPNKVKEMTPKEKEKNTNLCEIKKAMMGFANIHGTQQQIVFQGQINKALRERGGSAIAPRKKAGPNGEEELAERGKIKAKGISPRSGLLAIDKDNSGWTAGWPWQTLPQEYFDCKEVWSGHYSGSILEILFMLDMFTKSNGDVGGDDPMKSFDEQTMLETPSRKCKAALAGAFLIAIGYHSAIEVKPTIWLYLGKQKPPIFSIADQQCDMMATTHMENLMKSCTAR